MSAENHVVVSDILTTVDLPISKLAVMSTALGKVTTTYYSNKQQNICSIATSKK
jgi:hypothetical protein